jgi:hypothetical protein
MSVNNASPFRRAENLDPYSPFVVLMNQLPPTGRVITEVVVSRFSVVGWS